MLIPWFEQEKMILTAKKLAAFYIVCPARSCLRFSVRPYYPLAALPADHKFRNHDSAEYIAPAHKPSKDMAKPSAPFIGRYVQNRTMYSYVPFCALTFSLKDIAGNSPYKFRNPFL